MSNSSRLRCDDLMKINTSLISESTERKHESAGLMRELLLYEERKETGVLVMYCSTRTNYVQGNVLTQIVEACRFKIVFHYFPLCKQ